MIGEQKKYTILNSIELNLSLSHLSVFKFYKLLVYSVSNYFIFITRYQHESSKQGMNYLIKFIKNKQIIINNIDIKLIITMDIMDY